jgi:hypothetical protein
LRHLVRRHGLIEDSFQSMPSKPRMKDFSQGEAPIDIDLKKFSGLTALVVRFVEACNEPKS